MEQALASLTRGNPADPADQMAKLLAAASDAAAGNPLKMMENQLAYTAAGLGIFPQHQRGGSKHACDADCSHAKKLRSLRRNIVRMLSVLTPDIAIESGLDVNTDQVDDLLHEVIYSNMAEQAGKQLTAAN